MTDRTSLKFGTRPPTNVGAKPSDPWTAMEVAQTARRHLHLQNTIHWIKSIAIDQDTAGASAGLERDLAVGHYKPINSDRFVNDCHEFVFQFTPEGRTPLDRRAIGVAYQDASRTSPAGGPAAATGAAAGTPGSSLTKPSRAATRIGRIRQPSRPVSRPIACASTACHGCVW